MMKKILTFSLLLTAFGVHAQKKAQLILRNATTLERPDELVSLPRSLIRKKLGVDAPYITLTKNGTSLPVQLADLDGDGRWDEAVLLYTFGPNEQVKLELAAAQTGVQAGTVRAHVRMRKKDAAGGFGPQLLAEEMPFRNPATDFSKQPLPLYLTEGPAWENDRVGFRLYFDVRNGKDIWGKTTTAMVLDSVGVDPRNNYHQRSPWGMDVLKVGRSLGAGALALSFPQPGGRDTLVRLGEQLVQKATYTQLADGPLLARMLLRYQCVFNNQPFEVSETISIWGGQLFYESTVVVNGAPAGTRLVSGMPNLYPNTVKQENIDRAALLYSHGRQSENKDMLGMAIMVPQQTFKGWQTIDNPRLPVTDTYTIAQDAGKPALFRFYAVWEQTEPRFASQDAFVQMLQKEAERFSRPIIVQ